MAEGTVHRLGRGIYRKTGAPIADEELIEVALRAPEATLCLTSALAHHELTDEIPSRIDVALPRTRRQPRVNAPVRWHRFADATFHLGRELLQVDDGVRIGLYSAERTIVDSFRLRHLEGEAPAVEALRRWLRTPGATPAMLLDLARRFPKAHDAVLTTLKILL